MKFIVLMCKDNRKYAWEHDVIENRTCIPAQTTQGHSEFQYLICMFQTFIWIDLFPRNQNAQLSCSRNTSKSTYGVSGKNKLLLQ